MNDPKVAPVEAQAVPDLGVLCPTAPERIWLQVDPEPVDDVPTFPHDDDVTWCRDQINANDTLYIRADAAAQLVAASPAAAAVPDDVWEALQRMIENAASLGPACQEDALLVARWRGQFVAARESASPAAGVPTQQKENSNEGSTAQAPALGVDVAGSVRAGQGDGQMESQAHAAAGTKAIARLNWLHSYGSHNVDGWEWGIYRVRWIAGNTAEVLQTGSDFSDLDLAMGASPVAPVGAPTEDEFLLRMLGETVKVLRGDGRLRLAADVEEAIALLSRQGCELATDATKQQSLTDEQITAMHRSPDVRDALLAYFDVPNDKEASGVIRAILSHLAATPIDQDFRRRPASSEAAPSAEGLGG